MNKNVLIPADLFERIFLLMENWDFPVYHELYSEFCDIRVAIRFKMRKIELREAYADIICAVDENAAHFARIDYLRLKELMRLDSYEIPF